jgi:enamine deaminase RidA (YjgF/YER057c/UK114 family)
MALERINPAGIYKPNRGLYTQVVRATGTTQIHVAGTVPFDQQGNVVGVGDMKAQVTKVLDNLERSLAAAGARPSDVVRICVYAVDVDRYIEEGTPELLGFFGDHKPVSTTCGVQRLVHPDWLVEIEATAIID